MYSATPHAQRDTGNIFVEVTTWPVVEMKRVCRTMYFGTQYFEDIVAAQEHLYISNTQTGNNCMSSLGKCADVS